MSNLEAANALRAIAHALYKTGKDEPLKDKLIPAFKEACNMGAEALEALEAREKSERTHDVIEAMERYARAKELIPIEWIETLKRLIS